MKQWELNFKHDENGYAAEVPEDLRHLLEKHQYMGFAFRHERTIQLYTEEQLEALNQRMEKLPQGRHAARLLFRYMEVMEETDRLQVPMPLAAYAGMEEWEALAGVAVQDGEQIYLVDKNKLDDFMEDLSRKKLAMKDEEGRSGE